MTLRSSAGPTLSVPRMSSCVTTSSFARMSSVGTMGAAIKGFPTAVSGAC